MNKINTLENQLVIKTDSRPIVQKDDIFLLNKNIRKLNFVVHPMDTIHASFIRVLSCCFDRSRYCH